MKDLKNPSEQREQVDKRSEHSERGRLISAKERLLKELIEEGWLKSEKVIRAFKKVPRENFVPQNLKKYSYVNEPLPIGYGQTISQPLTVIAMTEALDVREGQSVLEIGSGSGYQAAILSQIVGKKGQVITIERIEELYKFAKNNLKNYKNVRVIFDDGTLGYQDNNISSKRTQKEMMLTRRETLVSSPVFDRIIVTASAPNIPQSLIDQLKPLGKLIIPIGQEMFLIEKDKTGETSKKSLGYYVFVPLIGKHGFKE